MTSYIVDQFFVIIHDVSDLQWTFIFLNGSNITINASNFLGNSILIRLPYKSGTLQLLGTSEEDEIDQDEEPDDGKKDESFFDKYRFLIIGAVAGVLLLLLMFAASRASVEQEERERSERRGKRSKRKRPRKGAKMQQKQETKKDQSEKE